MEGRRPHPCSPVWSVDLDLPSQQSRDGLGSRLGVRDRIPALGQELRTTTDPLPEELTTDLQAQEFDEG